MTRILAGRGRAVPGTALSSHIPYGGVLALMLAAPFEKIQPIITLYVQRLTSVELVMLVALAGWAVSWRVSGKRPQFSTPLTLPVLLLLGVMVLSALMAPGYQREALLFTARFAVGFLVYLLVVNSVTTQWQLLGVMAAAGVAGTVVAILGILEYRQIPAVIEWLHPFKHGLVMVGGEIRVSSTLQYPTITSMYLELVFGLMLGMLLLTVSRCRWGAAILVFIVLGLIAETIILTLSRSGLLSMAGMLAVAGGLWLVRRGPDPGFWAIAAVTVMIAGLLGYRVINDSMLRLRLTTENDESWYRARYQVPAQLSFETGQVQQVKVTVTNTGRATWRPDGEAPFRLSYHWLMPDQDQVIVFEGLRTDFPQAVKPGQSITLQAWVQAPSQPGQYRLAWDVLQEGRLWFSTEGSPSAHSFVTVRGAPIDQPQPTPMPVPKPSRTIGRRTLWQLAGQMLAERPLLGVGPDNFRLLYGPYAGLERWNQGLHTNNMYIEFFVDTGIVGGLLFLWLVWRVLATLRRAWQQLAPRFAGQAAEEQGTTWLPMYLGVAAAVTAFLLHGFVDYFFEFTSTYLMIWMTLGLATALERQENDAYRF